MNETKVNVSGISEWNKEDIERTLKNMADTTKAEFDRLYKQPCMTDEEAEDLATD